MIKHTESYAPRFYAKLYINMIKKLYAENFQKFSKKKNAGFTIHNIGFDVIYF